jgi:hypothetical protein
MKLASRCREAVARAARLQEQFAETTTATIDYTQTQLTTPPRSHKPTTSHQQQQHVWQEMERLDQQLMVNMPSERTATTAVEANAAQPPIEVQPAELEVPEEPAHIRTSAVSNDNTATSAKEQPSVSLFLPVHELEVSNNNTATSTKEQPSVSLLSPVRVPEVSNNTATSSKEQPSVSLLSPVPEQTEHFFSDPVTVIVTPDSSSGSSSASASKLVSSDDYEERVNTSLSYDDDDDDEPYLSTHDFNNDVYASPARDWEHVVDHDSPLESPIEKNKTNASTLSSIDLFEASFQTSFPNSFHTHRPKPKIHVDYDPFRTHSPTDDGGVAAAVPQQQPRREEAPLPLKWGTRARDRGDAHSQQVLMETHHQRNNAGKQQQQRPSYSFNLLQSVLSPKRKVTTTPEQSPEWVISTPPSLSKSYAVDEQQQQLPNRPLKYGRDDGYSMTMRRKEPNFMLSDGSPEWQLHGDLSSPPKLLAEQPAATYSQTFLRGDTRY